MRAPLFLFASTCLLFASPLLADEDADARFEALVDDYEAHALAHDLIRAGREGDLDAAARWPDVSFDTVASRRDAEAQFLQRLEDIPVDALSSAGKQTSHGVLDYLLRTRVALAAFDPERISFTNDFGFFATPTQVAGQTRLRNAEQAEAWIARVERIPDFFADHQAWLERALEDGIVQPASIMDGVLGQIRALAQAEPEEHPLYAPMEQLPSRMDATARARLESATHAAIEQHALPAYARLLEFFEDVYLAEPRDTIAFSALPGGRAWYRELVRHHTSLDTTPEEVHRQGEAEVARIRDEMEDVIEETGFDGTFAEFLEYLRTDPKFYADSERELLMHASYIAKRADDAMPEFFRHLPRLPYGVRPVPDDIAPNYTTGRYWRGDLESGVAGGYMVNTYRLDQRPLYELPALTLHEAVPGHHHQIAIMQELDGVPDFRRNASITAFSEGWALYTEHLGIEMDIYETPYEHFGRLTYEMWRACRLVVDTGMHYFGWSRERAEACLLENSALSTHNVRTEIDRYISWPGQALAYKTGELLIRELRADAEATLGDEFDLRAFHDHLLGAGAIPLILVETRMREWIEDHAQ